MDLALFSVATNFILLGFVVYLWRRFTSTRDQNADLTREAAYAAGYQQGRAELLESIRYEREIHECRRVGVIKKETALKIRERVMLGHLRIAETEREVIVSSEVDEENVWKLLERGQALVMPEVGKLVQTLNPAVQKLLAAKGQKS